MDKIVIISGKARNFCPENEIDGISQVITQDVVKTTEEIVGQGRNEPVLAVICITEDEYNEISKGIECFPVHDMLYMFIVCGDIEKFLSNDNVKEKNISEIRESPYSAARFDFVLSKSFGILNEYYSKIDERDEFLQKLIDTRQDQEDLINIGKALSSEKDPDQLLTLILFLSKKITGADAGSIYLVEETEDGEHQLRFKYSHTFSREVPLEEFVIPMNRKSIAGYVAVTGEVLNIPDAYKLPEDATYSFNSSFDKNNNYLCRSMLVVPMRNHLDEIIGVIQLINSKKENHRGKSEKTNVAFSLVLETMEDFDRYVVTFDEKYDSLLEAIAGQAAVSIENNLLIKRIQTQFEEFVRASVTAIESRDPATSGHSFRVAEICKELAYAVNETDDGYLKDYFFNEDAIRELEFAALLHDFGKVYIDLAIFKKAKKLFPKDLENLAIRLDYLYRYVELVCNIREKSLYEKKIDQRDGTLFNEHELLMTEKEKKLETIRSIKEKIFQLNEPTVMEQDPEEVLREILDEIEEIECLDIDGRKMPIITDYDKMNLTIRRGSLNPKEREEIESHVVHTYNFVSKIPWPSEYKNIPEIALRHHETIDGSGYPGRIKGRESTLLQSRMMTIADIYDALTASDRPYKKAVPLERVLKILQEEAERGKLDVDLVNVFIDKKVYEKL